MKRWDVYVYGDVNIDEIITGASKIPPYGQEWEVDNIKTCIGGGAALFAMGIGKLGLKPVFKGSVGDDFYGEYIKNTFIGLNIDTALLNQKPGKATGITLSFTNEKDRSFLTFRGTNEALNIENIRLEEVDEARHIHLTGYEANKNHNLYLELLKNIKEKTSASISMDVGWDESGEWSASIYEVFPYLDILFMNETEGIHYSRKNDIMEAAKDFSKFAKIAVVKLGSKGAVAVSDGRVYKDDGFKVNVVDTTGAGDSFNAGFIYGYLTGKDIAGALKYGNGCGALSCTGLGGNTAFPNKDELEKFIRG